jgi:hypothetical protein
VKKFLALVFAAVVFAALFFNTGCRKEQFGNGPISFSTDTLTFDTVFATFGSTTRYFKVFNDNNKAVKINDLRLMHLVGTQFRINVDGVSGDQFSEVEIPAKDSIYVFVEVTVNPNDQTTPYVIIDDVVFTVGSKTETVHLQAFGQNAHFHYGEEITSSTTWTNDLPHVIISKDTVPGVYVRCGATLTINAGCKVFFAGNSALFVEGTLKAEATQWSDSIVFQGARLESYYNDKPGQWFGIVFLRNNTCVPKGYFNHCSITESSYGIYAGAGLSSDIADYLGSAQRPDVSIKNSIIKHSLYNGIYGFNAKISAENSLFYVAGEHLVKLGLGGEYSFNHCTLFNNGSRYVAHEKEALLLSNLLADGNSNVYKENLQTTFTNCIVYGNMENEISFSNADNLLLTDFDNKFSNCLMKTKSDTLGIFSTLNNQNLFNQDPRFKELDKDNYMPSDSAGYFSPAIDYAASGLSTDLYDRLRPVSKTANSNKFDIGAIEAQ